MTRPMRFIDSVVLAVHGIIAVVTIIAPTALLAFGIALLLSALG